MFLYVIAAFLLLYFFLVLYFNGSPRRSNEPPLAGYWIPYIGLTAQFGQNPMQFSVDNYNKYGDVFTAIIQGKRTHFILNPEDFQTVFKDDKVFTFDEHVDKFGERLSGLNFPKEHSIASQTTFRGLTNPESLEPLTKSFTKHFKLEIEKIKDGKVKLYDFMRKLLYRASANSLFGISYDAIGTQDDYYTFVDGCKFLLAGGVLSLFGGAALKAREKIIKAIYESKPEEYSDYLKLRKDYFDEHNIPKDEFAIHNIPIIFAAITNTAPATFWIMYYLINHQELIPDLLKETKDFYESNFDLKQYNQDGILEKLINESLRLSTGTSTNRSITKDFVFKTKSGKEYHMRKGDDVMLLFSFLNHRDEHYENPFQFDINHDFKKKPLHVFGGGKHLCPGRLFFRNEARVMVVQFIHNFEFKLDSTKLEFDWTSAPLQVLAPIGDIECEIKRKK